MLRSPLPACLAGCLLAAACGGSSGSARPDGGTQAAPDAAGTAPDAGAPAPDAGVDPAPPDGGDGGSHDPGAIDAGTTDAGGGMFPEPDGGGVRVTVMTINLQNIVLNPRDVDGRTAAVATLIAERQPDVVACQEVSQSNRVENRLDVLARMTGYEEVWHQTSSVPGVWDEGLGILSRWPVSWSEAHELPHTDLGLFHRYVLGAGVATPDGELRIFDTHMTIDEDPEVKADQAVAALRFMATRPGDRPALLAGDFNALPDSLAMRVLRGEATWDQTTGDLLDAWLQAQPDDPGYTYPAEDPDRRIDYIYVEPASGGAPAHVEACERLFVSPAGGPRPSDHLGVLCEFTL